MIRTATAVKCLVATAIVLCSVKSAGADTISLITVTPNGTTGQNANGVGIAESVRFTLAQAYSNVDIAVMLGCCNNGMGAAYLTTAQGPGTTSSSEIAHSATFLAPNFGVPTSLTLFSGLSLSANTYYLVLGALSGSVGWLQAASGGFTVAGEPGNVLGGNFYGTGSGYLPGFTYSNLGTANQSHLFSVTTSSVPDSGPGIASVLMTAIGMLFYATLKQRSV